MKFPSNYPKSILSSFILICMRKCNEIEHLAHAAANAVSVTPFHLGAVQIGGGMGDHALVNEQIITDGQDLRHRVADGPVIRNVLFKPEIVKTNGARLFAVDAEGTVRVAVDDIVSVLGKFQADLGTGPEQKTASGITEPAQDLHDSCFAAANRT